MNRLFSRFTYCFIPDLPGETNLAGRLSHIQNPPPNARFIGLLSRFTLDDPSRKYEQTVFCTVILSGPEPQRSILKGKLDGILGRKGKPAVMLEGRPGDTVTCKTKGNIEYISHLPSQGMKELLLRSEHIITRSGYTTLMELVSLGISALIIPTPGQTEQEYLATLMKERGWFATVTQEKLNDDITLSETDPVWPGSMNIESRELLRSALDELLEQDHD